MSTPSVRSQHAEWLAALDGDGPWLTVPALTELIPAGLIPTSPEQNRALKAAHTEWSTTTGTAALTEWVRFVVTDLLGWGDHASFTSLDRYTHTHVLSASKRITTPATFALLPVAQADADSDTVPIALGFTYPTEVTLTQRVGDGWPTTPIDRATHALRAANIPLGIVTNGKWWALIWAPRQSTPGYALWTNDLLLDDELLRSAFTTLLSRHRSLAVTPEESLHGLFWKSQDSQEDITDNLSKQVRNAVELLVDSFSTANHAASGAYFTKAAATGARVSDDDIYQAAVTIVMRLVFILAAEERGLLPADDDFYATAYGVGALADQLIDRGHRDGEELLRESSSVFPQILAISRVIHDGVRHPRLNLPGYGGSVFDPTRHPWLETAPNDPTLGPISVDDRTMLHILRGLTRWEGRRLSYRTLDVEQIGYAYEGLLDHTAKTAVEPVLGILGKKEPEIPLSELEALATRGDKALTDWLKKSADLSAGKTKAALAARGQLVDAVTRQRLEAACDSDSANADRIQPWLALLRTDPRTGLPLIINPGTTYVTASSARGDTGTHYTPKFLAEEVVKSTLDGILYSPGPLDSNDSETWQPIHPEQIIHLKVADIAMGSGAFLVASIRYVADVLLQSLEGVSRDTLTTPALTDLWNALHRPNGDRPDWDTTQDDETVLAAQRLIAARCIYGVDINPMAVEMAKLSIWLVTASRNQPFSFLDHRLLTGDSLLGLHDIRQLENLHLKPERGIAKFGDAKSTLFNFTDAVQQAISRITELRTQIDKQNVVDLRSIEEQERLHHEAKQLTTDLALVADGITAASLAASKAGGNYDKALDAKTAVITEHVQSIFAADRTNQEKDAARHAISRQVEAWLDLDLPEGSFTRKPQHWPLMYPEVFASTAHGFSAVVGNPPFLGGKKISGAFGSAYREHLVADEGRGEKGNADLVAYMLLQADRLTSPKHGQVGILATNTVAEGDTREIGLDQITGDGTTIRFATKSRPWPSRNAALNYSVVGLSHAPSQAAPILEGLPLSGRNGGPGVITPSLTQQGRAAGNPFALAANQGMAFQGSIILGMGFTMSPAEAQHLIEQDSNYRKVLFPYLGGEDLNSSPTQTASRWIVNFFDWDIDRAKRYPAAFSHVQQLVMPERQLKDATKYPKMVNQWWRYWNERSELYSSIRDSDSAIVVARASNTVQPIRVPSAQVFSDQIVVFASSSPGMLALLTSAIHGEWVRARTSTIGAGAGIRYTPSDVFETFPFPTDVSRLSEVEETFETVRSVVMKSRSLGLTDVYNLENDANVTDNDVEGLRVAHRDLDCAVLAAYGWSDIDPDHGFYDTAQGVRFTLGPAARDEVLDRLLELNHQRHAEELASGLVDEQGRPLRKSAGKSRSRSARSVTGAVQAGLFADPGGEQEDLLSASEGSHE